MTTIPDLAGELYDACDTKERQDGTPYVSSTDDRCVDVARAAHGDGWHLPCDWHCDREHPIGDAEADRWCEDYHRPALPTPLPLRCDNTTNPAMCGKITHIDAKGYIYCEYHALRGRKLTRSELDRLDRGLCVESY